MVRLLSFSLLLAAVAVLPPELLARARGWAIVDPGYLGAQLAWWLPDLALRLILLWRVGLSLGLRPKILGPSLVFRRALATELRVALGLCVVTLVALIPAAWWIASFGLDTLSVRAIAIALFMLAAIPAALYLLRRMLTPCVLLWEGGSYVAALNRSARLSRGYSVLLWLFASAGLSFGLDQALGLLPAPWDLSGACLAWVVQTAPLAWIYRRQINHISA